MNRINATKDKRLLVSYLVPALLLVLPLSYPYWPRLPLPAPWSSWSPVIGIILTKGAWCHSFLPIITQSAFVMTVLIATLTCRTSGVLWTPTTVIQNSALIPLCWTRQCFHRVISSSSSHRASWCSIPLVKAFCTVFPS